MFLMFQFMIIFSGNVTYAYHRFGPLPNRIEGGPYEALVLIMGFTADMYNWHPQVSATIQLLVDSYAYNLASIVV